MSIRAVQGVGHGEAFVPVKDGVRDHLTTEEIDQLSHFEKTVKASNPKDAIGSRKAPFGTVPQQVVAEVGLALLEGAVKYGRHNYRAIGVRSSVYYDATHRHLGAWWEGQDIDPRSGLHHITKAIASLVVLRDAMIQGKCEDDRPPPVADPDWVEKINAEAARILDEHPNPLPPYTIGRPK